MHTLTERDRGLVQLLLRFSFLVLSNGGSSGQWRSVPSMECTAATHTPIMNTQDYWHDTWTRGHSAVSASVCVLLQGTRTHAIQTAYRFQQEEYSKGKRWVGLLQVHCLE